MMQNVLSRLDKMDKVHNPAPKGKKVWVRKYEIIHPLKDSELT
jgi:hypothetical protein